VWSRCGLGIVAELDNGVTLGAHGSGGHIITLSVFRSSAVKCDNHHSR